MQVIVIEFIIVVQFGDFVDEIVVVLQVVFGKMCFQCGMVIQQGMG